MISTRGAPLKRLPFARLALGLLAGVFAATPALAEHTRFWRVSDYAEFSKGTAKGVALRSDGTLVPAPEFRQFSDPNIAYLWTLRMDSRGQLYASGGSNAKMLRFDPSGKETVVFQSQELAAQALAIDARDNLYVGTSPDGKVYKVTPEGKSSVFFDPKTKYIWALVFDREGVLYVATGDTGKVFAVTPEGRSTVFYKSDEQHVRALAFDREGNLVLGTDPSGLIVRVPVKRRPNGEPPEAGRSFVLYETEGKEITSLAVDSQGDLYAASIGEKPRQPTPPVAAPALPAATVEAIASFVGSTFGQAQAHPATPQVGTTPPVTEFTPFPGGQNGSHIYRLAPDGSPKLLWSSPTDLVYALGFSPGGKLLLGTGNRGVVIQLDEESVFSELAKTAALQVTGLATAADGTVYLSTANPGKVFALGPSLAGQGSYESEPFDAKIFSRWGRLGWWGQHGADDGKVVFYLRSGNTSKPDKNWSPWFGPYADAQRQEAGCPPARFAQWKAEFQGVPARSSSAGETPSISWVSLAYLPKNVAPSLDSIVLEDPGIRTRQMVIPMAYPGMTSMVQLRMPQTTQPGQPTIPATAAYAIPRVLPPPQGFREKGWQSVLWSAHDPNDDDLVYSVYYRAEGEKEWKLLKDKIHEEYYSWDTTTMPDGAYYLKIVASDSPSNPPANALSRWRVSGRFVVDNSPPVIENLGAEERSGAVEVHFDARDPASPLEHAQYSVDAGDWTLLFPIGQLSDSPREAYRFELGGLAPGEHTVSVRVFDQFENSSIAKVTFTVPATRNAR
jgi:outer membrane protein assembly factor BamB